jgi:hypothetical protein
VKISLSEDGAKGIYSVTTVVRIIIGDSAPSSCPGNSKGKIIEDTASLSSRRLKT